MRVWFGILLGVAVNFMWALGFLFPHLLRSVDTVLLAAGRYAAYGLLSAIFLMRGSGIRRNTIRRRDWLWAMAFAFAGNVGYYTILVWSIRFGGVAVAALIAGTLPVTMAVYGNWHDQPFRRGALLPLGMILAGLIALNGLKFAAADSSRETQHLAAGIVCGVLALSMWTWYGVHNARYLKANPHVSGAAWSSLVGVCTLALTVLALPVLASLGVWSADSLAVVFASPRMAAAFLGVSLVLGVVVSWFATLLWNHAARFLPVGLAGQLIVFETLASIFYTSMADKKLPSFLEFACMGFVLLGVVLSVRVVHRQMRGQPGLSHA